MDSPKIVLDLCGGTGSWSRPGFAWAFYEANKENN